MQEGLREKAIRLLNERSYRIKDKDISEEIGVSKPWLSMLRKGSIKNPSVVKIEKLIRFLETNSTD